MRRNGVWRTLSVIHFQTGWWRHLKVESGSRKWSQVLPVYLKPVGTAGKPAALLNTSLLKRQVTLSSFFRSLRYWEFMAASMDRCRLNAACNSLLTCTPPQLPVLPEHLGTWMHTDNKKPLMAQNPAAAAWNSACQKRNFYYNYYYYPAAFATFPCFTLKPWTPPLCSREATLSFICRLELNLCCRVTCNALETSLTAGVQWLGTGLWMLVYINYNGN